MYCAVYHRASGLIVPAELLGLASISQDKEDARNQRTPTTVLESSSSSDSGDEGDGSPMGLRAINSTRTVRRRRCRDYCFVHFRHEASSEVRVVHVTDVLPFGYTSPQELFSEGDSARGRHTNEGMIIATASVQTPIVSSSIPPSMQDAASPSPHHRRGTSPPLNNNNNNTTTGDAVGEMVTRPGSPPAVEPTTPPHQQTSDACRSSSSSLVPLPPISSDKSGGGGGGGAASSTKSSSQEVSNGSGGGGGGSSAGTLVSPINIAALAAQEVGVVDSSPPAAEGASASSTVAALLSTATFRKTATTEGRRRQFGELTPHDQAASAGNDVDQFITNMFFSSCTLRSYRSEQFGLLSTMPSVTSNANQYGTSLQLVYTPASSAVTSVSIDDVSTQLHTLIGSASRKDMNRFRAGSSSSTLAPVHSRPPTSMMSIHGPAMAKRVMSNLTMISAQAPYSTPSDSALLYLERHVPDEVRAAAALLLPHLVDLMHRSGSSNPGDSSSSGRRPPSKFFRGAAAISMDEDSFHERLHHARVSIDDSPYRSEMSALFNRFYRQLLAPEHQHQFDLFMYHGNQLENGPQNSSNQQRAKLQKSAAMVQIQQMHQKPAVLVPQTKLLWKALEYGMYRTRSSEDLRNAARLQVAELFGCYFQKSCRKIFFVPLDPSRTIAETNNNNATGGGDTNGMGASSSRQGGGGPTSSQRKQRRKRASVDETPVIEHTLTIVLPPPLGPSAALLALDATRRARLQLEQQLQQQQHEKKADQERQRNLKELDALAKTLNDNPYMPLDDIYGGGDSPADPFASLHLLGETFGAQSSSSPSQPVSPSLLKKVDQWGVGASGGSGGSRGNSFIDGGGGMAAPRLRSSLAVPSHTYGGMYMPQQPAGPTTGPVVTIDNGGPKKPRYRMVNTTRRTNYNNSQNNNTNNNNSSTSHSHNYKRLSDISMVEEQNTLCIVTLDGEDNSGDDTATEDQSSSELEEGVVRFPPKKGPKQPPRQPKTPKSTNDIHLVFGTFGTFGERLDAPMSGTSTPRRSICSTPHRALDEHRLSVSTQGLNNMTSRRSSMLSNTSSTNNMKSRQQRHAEEIIHNMTTRKKRNVQLVLSQEESTRNTIRANVGATGGVPLRVTTPLRPTNEDDDEDNEVGGSNSFYTGSFSNSASNNPLASGSGSSLSSRNVSRQHSSKDISPKSSQNNNNHSPNRHPANNSSSPPSGEALSPMRRLGTMLYTPRASICEADLIPQRSGSGSYHPSPTSASQSLVKTPRRPTGVSNKGKGSGSGVESRMWLAKPSSKVVIPLDDTYISQRPLDTSDQLSMAPPPPPPRRRDLPDTTANTTTTTGEDTAAPSYSRYHDIVPREYVDGDNISPAKLDNYFYDKDAYLRHTVKTQLAARRTKEKEMNTVNCLKKILNSGGRQSGSWAEDVAMPCELNRDALTAVEDGGSVTMAQRIPLPPSTYVSGGGKGRPPPPESRNKRIVADDVAATVPSSPAKEVSSTRTPVFTLLRPLRFLGLPVMLSQRRPLPPFAVGCSVLFRRKGCMLTCEDPDIGHAVGVHISQFEATPQKESTERIRAYGLSIGLVEGVITAAHYDCRYTIRFGTTTVDATTSQIVKNSTGESGPSQDEEVGVLHNDIYLIDTTIADRIHVRDDVTISIPTGTIPPMMDKDDLCTYLRTIDGSSRGIIVASLGRVAEEDGIDMTKPLASGRSGKPSLSDNEDNDDDDDADVLDTATTTETVSTARGDAATRSAGAIASQAGERDDGNGDGDESSNEADDDSVMEEKVRRQYNLHTRLDNQERDRRKAQRLKRVEMSTCCLRDPYESIVLGSERLKAQLYKSPAFVQAVSVASSESPIMDSKWTTNQLPQSLPPSQVTPTALIALQDAVQARFKGVFSNINRGGDITNNNKAGGDGMMNESDMLSRLLRAQPPTSTVAKSVPSGSWFLVAMRPHSATSRSKPLLYTVHESFISQKRPAIGLPALGDTCSKHTRPKVDDIAGVNSTRELHEHEADCDNLVSTFNTLDAQGRGHIVWKDVRNFILKRAGVDISPTDPSTKAASVVTCFVTDRAEAAEVLRKKIHRCYQQLMQVHATQVQHGTQEGGAAFARRQLFNVKVQQDEFPLSFTAFAYVCRWMETHADISIVD